MKKSPIVVIKKIRKPKELIVFFRPEPVLVKPIKK